ncbi:MAG: hypothetical protein MSB01_00730, partial [Bacteroidales bacterium]|nr:hypothetical protein [Bacteroidales bacterium]
VSCCVFPPQTSQTSEYEVLLQFAHHICYSFISIPRALQKASNFFSVRNEGLITPFSHLLIVTLETPNSLARSFWLMSKTPLTYLTFSANVIDTPQIKFV